MARKRRHFPDTPLANYIHNINTWVRLMRKPGEEIIKWPPNKDDCTRIVYELETDLSPENISCDGEVHGAELAAEYERYRVIIKELCTYDPASHGVIRI